jgi:hypothetical protein
LNNSALIMNDHQFNNEEIIYLSHHEILFN